MTSACEPARAVLQAPCCKRRAASAVLQAPCCKRRDCLQAHMSSVSRPRPPQDRAQVLRGAHRRVPGAAHQQRRHQQRAGAARPHATARWPSRAAATARTAALAVWCWRRGDELVMRCRPASPCRAPRRLRRRSPLGARWGPRARTARTCPGPAWPGCPACRRCRRWGGPRRWPRRRRRQRPPRPRYRAASLSRSPS
jgi:hypothetical protein